MRSNDGPTDGVTNLLQVAESDLQTASAQYFIEARYVIQDDVNPLNNVGWRRFTPSFSGGVWTFTLATSLSNGPALDAWVDPQNPPAGQAHTAIDDSDGLLRLAVQTTDLGGGQWRYDYALQNLDFDRRIRSFTVPLRAGVAVSNLRFADADSDAANDWSGSINAGAVVWATSTMAQDPNANALDWGQLYDFGFDADTAPVNTNVTLGVFEPGASTELVASTLGVTLQPTLTPPPTLTPTITSTPTMTRTPTQTGTPTQTRTPTSTRTPTATRSSTRTSTATRTRTSTPPPTQPGDLTFTPTATPQQTPTEEPSISPTPSPLPPTASPTETGTAAPTGTPTPVLPVIDAPLVAGQEIIQGACQPLDWIRVYAQPPAPISPELLGETQCTEQGRIADSPGLALPRPLQGGERVFGLDLSSRRSGPGMIVEPVPLGSRSWALLAAAATLLAGLLRRSRRRRPTAG